MHDASRNRTTLLFQMSAGEKITAESGAMVYVKGDIEVKTMEGDI